jgi:hypothetical protein
MGLKGKRMKGGEVRARIPRARARGYRSIAACGG